MFCLFIHLTLCACAWYNYSHKEIKILIEKTAVRFWLQIWGRRKVMDAQRKWLWEVWRPRKWQWMINRTFCTFRDEGSSCHRRRFCFADDFFIVFCPFCTYFLQDEKKNPERASKKKIWLVAFLSVKLYCFLICDMQIFKGREERNWNISREI